MSAGRKQRRSFTTVKRGRIDTGGDDAASARLAEALRAASDDRVAHELTHGFHTYPARLHPATARLLVSEVLGDRAMGRRPPVVLDPFCGSGTVLVEARFRGARARGVDANPLALLVARAKTAVGRPEWRARIADTAGAIAEDVIETGRTARRRGQGAAPHRTIKGIDEQTRARQLAQWFDPHVRRELEALAAAVDTVRSSDARLADVLMAVLSSLLYKVSRRESDTSDRQVQRKIARGACARLFATRAQELVDGLEAIAAVSGPNVGIARGDARRLDKADIEAGSVAGIVTSPPYPGTYDYASHQALRFAFLGLGGKKFEVAEIGARRQFRGSAAERRRARDTWVRDMKQVVKQMTAVLVPGGLAAVVIGDSYAGGRAMFADRQMAHITARDLELVAWASQHRPLVTAGEQRAFSTAPKREHVLLYRRPG